MVGIVVISHSSKIAEGAIEMALQMAPDVPMMAAGGTNDGRIGTDVEKISEAIKKVYSEDGVLLLFDLGSAYMNAEMAIDFIMGEVNIDKVQLVDCALIEGSITAAVESSIGASLENIKETLKPLALNKMP